MLSSAHEALPWKLNAYSYGVLFGINCIALKKSELSNFMACTIVILHQIRDTTTTTTTTVTNNSKKNNNTKKLGFQSHKSSNSNHYRSFNLLQSQKLIAHITVQDNTLHVHLYLLYLLGQLQCICISKRKPSNNITVTIL